MDSVMMVVIRDFLRNNKIAIIALTVYNINCQKHFTNTHLICTDSSLLRTACFVPVKRKLFHFP